MHRAAAFLITRSGIVTITTPLAFVQVYHLMQHVIFQHTFLLYNRHLDQVMLSAIYGVCKVAQLKQISFKLIINHYRRQPQAKSDIFRTVVLEQSEPELQVPPQSFRQSSARCIDVSTHRPTTHEPTRSLTHALAQSLDH